MVHLSVLTLGEIMCGIVLKQKNDPKSAAHLAEWLGKLRHDHAKRILLISDQIAVEWGLIAAIVHDLIVVTRNVADFEDTGAIIVNPWDLDP